MGKTGRHFRLDNEVYAAAQERAKREYTNVTAVIERALARYAGLMGDDGYDAPPGRSGPELVTAAGLEAAHARKIAGDEPRTPKPLGYSKEQQAT